MATVRPNHPPTPKGVLCPYCGRISTDARRCQSCSGHFDPLSRQATQNSMGPWFIRDEGNPFRPGCSYETLRDLIRRGRITLNTVIRGPATRQYWNFAGRTPSVAHMLGICHNCRTEVNPDEFSCRACGASFNAETDRQHLGLAPVHLLPGQAAPEIVAAASLNPGAARSGPGAGGPPARPDPRRTPLPSPAPQRPPTGSNAWVIVLAAIIVVLAGALIALVLAMRFGVELPWLNSEPPAEPLPGPAAGTTEAPFTTEAAAPAADTPPAPVSEVAAPAAVDSTRSAVSPAPPSLAGLVLPHLSATDVNLGTARATLSELARDNPGRAAEISLWLGMLDRRGELVKLRELP